ncbi:MAG: hypothetical protein R2766_01390 [Saprospiraceae bacterium]
MLKSLILRILTLVRRLAGQIHILTLQLKLVKEILRDNLYSGSATGNLTSPNQVCLKWNGRTFSIDYKVVDWSAGTNPTADG